MARTPHGSIALVSTAGRLRLRFPRKWFAGEQKYLTLGLPENPDNRLHASNIIREMEWDYLKGKFDRTFGKYTINEKLLSGDLSLSALWVEYCQYKAKRLKPSTMHYMKHGLGRHISKCPYQAVNQSLDVMEWLLNNTTADMSRRVLKGLASAVSWGFKHDKIRSSINPFMGMASDIRIDKDRPHANAFSTEERDRIISAFKQSKDYSYYAPLVQFWFLTGCRPSEGIGLEWEQMNEDCSTILFDRSIVKVGGVFVKNNCSKNNRKRTFICQDELQAFLLDLQSQRKSKNRLVFPSKHGKPIDYLNFSKRAWDGVVDPLINRRTTPYNCRDTFITDQIGKGVSLAIIAQWCDNSVEIIEKYYFDISAISHIKPR